MLANDFSSPKPLKPKSDTNCPTTRPDGIHNCTNAQEAIPSPKHCKRTEDKVVEREWDRSIPEAGYITLGSLRYGVRLSNPSRLSYDPEAPVCAESNGTCSILLATPSPSCSVNSSIGRVRDGLPVKAESPICGNCCAGLANIRSELAPTTGVQRHCPQSRSPKSHQQQSPQFRSSVPRQRMSKNRTSTLSRPASSGEARQLQLSHPEILNGDESSWKSFPRSKSSDASVNAGSRLDCLLNPLLTDTQISRSHFETTKEQLPRRRSLPTEEDTRTTGCFNLRSSAVKKCRVNPIDGSKGNLEKPNWLNICDPCNKVLERSITPDISDVLLQKIDKSLRHLDTVAPSLAFGAESFTTVVTGHGNNRSIESERRTQNFVAPKGNLDIRVTCKNGGGTINSPLEYGRQGEHILKNNRPVGRSPKIIAENKVFRRSRRSDDADAVVANNNLCEKREIVACAESGRHLSRNVAVTDHRRLIRKIETATQFSEQSQRSNSDTGTFEVLSDRSAAEVKPSGGERRCPSFEEDYEKCIESINRQLSLEFGNADSKCKTKKLIESDQQPEVLQKLEDTMEKRRNTFERFQRWGFGQRSASNNDLAANGDPKKKDKSERLKELTELLKSTRIPSLTGFNRITLRESSTSPPPIPPPRRQRCGHSVEKSFDKLESIEDKELPACHTMERKISVPSMKINEPKTANSDSSRIVKPLHVSISSPHFRLLLDKSQPPHTTDCSGVPLQAEELFSLPKVEPKTIVGSYAQKNIPYRSASFSQVDYKSGKYSMGSPEPEQPREDRNSLTLVESCTYPRRRGDIRLLRNMKLGSPGPHQEHDHIIAEESSPEHEERRLSVLATIESYDIEESISEDTPTLIVDKSSADETATSPSSQCEENAVTSTTADELVPTITDQVKTETSATRANDDEDIVRTACIIPTPVFECCGNEVEQVTEWFQLRDNGPVNVSNNSCVVPRSPALSESPDTSRVEVRKRNTFSSDSGNSKQSSLEKNDEVPWDERRKIDKSKRRKGIYIQWPAPDKSQVGGPSWDIDSPDCDRDVKEPLKLNVNLGIHLDSLSIASCEPLTPDSDNCAPKPEWPNNPDLKKKSLTYQSSEEKDEVPKFTPKQPPLLGMDSTSDNESDRAACQEPRSASPSREDLKRYSKRPLRGPYGQMLEAEMKKASTLYYDEILDDLRSSDQQTRPSRTNASHSLDESVRGAANKVPKPRKCSAHLPVPFHERAASTPSQMDHQAEETGLSVMQKKFPNSIEKLYYDPKSKRKSSEALLSVSPTPPIHNKPCKRTTSVLVDRNSRKPTEKGNYFDGPIRKYSSETVDTPRGQVASNDLLAELLKGSSEVHRRQTMTTRAKSGSLGISSPKTLPEAVLKCLDTRTHVVIELFNTEQSYVDSLHTVITKYLHPLKSSDNLRDIVDTQLVDEIFYMVPSILGIHERFLEELHKRLGAWDANQKVGDAFIEVFSSSSVVEIYACFVNNWNKAKSAIRQACSAKPAFARFLETMAREHKGKLSLDNLLIKPVQKFPNYELILSRLIKHTNGEHPDQSLLQEANRLVHNILVQLNCKEREALENGQREATLRELEFIIEGITDLVTADRTFLLFDMVSMFSGQTTRKERGIFLFSDILVIASIKKRTGTIKKPNTSFTGAVAATLETNKYKFLTKMSLSELEIAKAKDENIRMLREMEHLTEDNTKIQKIIDIMNSIRFPHQSLEDSMRDLQKDVQKQLSDRQANDTQLSTLEFSLVSSDINQNMSIVFSKPEKRNQWEEAFVMAKQKLAIKFEKKVVPEFLTMIPIRKTRAGLQFTCAASTIGSMNDVWVCNSDGYVGQVCVLSLYPEPTVTSCNGVCNARILCVTSVPPASYSESSSLYARESMDGESSQKEKKSDNGEISTNVAETRIQLDSSSSSDNDSDIEFSGQLNMSSLSAPTTLELQAKEQSPAGLTNVSSTASLVRSEGEELDRTQSTMWLGTEDGCVHVYNSTDNIRIKKNKIKIQHSSAVYSILYLDNRVFVSLANGDICVYVRDNVGWNTSNPITISVGTVSSPVTKLLNVHGKIWCAIQGTIKVLNVQQLQIENQIQISVESKPITNLAASTNCVWITIQNSSIIKCYHSSGHELLFEVDVSNPVNKILSSCDEIIRQHKSACLRITSLLACQDLLWIGTSAGVLLNLPVVNSSKGLQHIVSSLTGIHYGHTGHVRFLTSVELNNPGLSASVSVGKSISGMGPVPKVAGNKLPATLVISGGDGYEDFRSSPANSANEVAGREDSTNHLLLWQM